MRGFYKPALSTIFTYSSVMFLMSAAAFANEHLSLWVSHLKHTFSTRFFSEFSASSELISFPLTHLGIFNHHYTLMLVQNYIVNRHYNALTTFLYHT